MNLYLNPSSRAPCLHCQNEIAGRLFRVTFRLERRLPPLRWADSWDNNGAKGRDYHVPIRPGSPEIVAAHRAARVTFPVEFLWTSAPGSSSVTVSPARDRVLPLKLMPGERTLWSATVEVPGGLDVFFRVEEGGKDFTVGPIRVFGPVRLSAGRLASMRSNTPSASESARLAR